MRRAKSLRVLVDVQGRLVDMPRGARVKAEGITVEPAIFEHLVGIGWVPIRWTITVSARTWAEARERMAFELELFPITGPGAFQEIA